MAYWTLPKLGREYYTVEILTTPQLSSWEITFDRGANWHSMQWDGTAKEASILVNGPGFTPPPGDVAVSVTVTKSVMPYIRAIDNPEVIVRTTPKIDLV
jgi:hypothetical protein